MMCRLVPQAAHAVETTSPSEVTFRLHIVPSGLLNPTGDVVAVRVYSQGVDYCWGLYDSGAPDKHGGSYDAGSSPGQQQTGYAVGATAEGGVSLLRWRLHERIHVAKRVLSWESPAPASMTSPRSSTLLDRSTSFMCA